MNCSGLRKRLLDYLEAERGLRGTAPLPNDLVSAIEAHLERCVTCREEAEAVRETFAIADMAGEVEPDGDFKLKTVRLLRQEAERAPARAPIAVQFRPVLAYAAVLMVLGVSLGVFLRGRDRATPVRLAASTDEFEEQVEQYVQEIEFLAGTLPGSDYETASCAERAHLDKIELLAGSIDECWDAFEENPESPRVRELLLAQMQEEIDALKEFHEVRLL